MTHLSLDPLFDFTIYALQVCSSFLPTYELHISFSCSKRKKRHNIFTAFGEDPQIPHILRDLRVSYNGISEFYLKTYKNSRTMVEQETWDIVLDLIVLSFSCSRPKWRLRKHCSNSWSITEFSFAQGLAKVKLRGNCWRSPTSIINHQHNLHIYLIPSPNIGIEV